MPALGPLGIGVPVTRQVRPKSRELKTRAADPPPVAKKAWPAAWVADRAGAETRQVPLAAKANSPSRAAGIPVSGSTDQERPPSRVARIRNLPSTGSERAR